MASRAQHKVLRAVLDALRRAGVARRDLILVALSGGPDSVAMLHALLAVRERLGYRLAAAHLNHALRGADSDRDEAFVRGLCARLSIEVCVERAEGLSPATPNLEEKAREARHSFLDRTAEQMGAAYISIAHHADDQAETVLLRLLRGAGAAGLAGMEENGSRRLIRPLLSLTREQIRDYLMDVGAPYVIDASNDSPAILRNRIRNHLIPMLEREYAPGIGRRLPELASEMRGLDRFATAEARRAMVVSDGALDLRSFAKLDPALRPLVIREFLEQRLGSLRRIGRAHIDAVCRLCLDGPPNGAVDVPGQLRVVREYGLLRAVRERGGTGAYRVPLAVEGVTEVAQAGMRFDSAIVPARGITRPGEKTEALFDAREAAGRLLVRSPRAGDRVAPIGMSGHRKLKEILIDAKVPKSKRDSFPIVELEGGGAVWVPGLVRARIALVSEATVRVLRVRSSPIRSGLTPLRAI